MTDEHIRDALKAIQWERAKGEFRAFAALIGSAHTGNTERYELIKDAVEALIANFEWNGYHE